MSATATTVVAPPLGRRDRKVAATRRAILDAALGLFAERGFTDTTIEQIAERADVGQRTFFRYFPTKESVIFADIEENWDRALAVFADRPHGEHPFTSLRAVVDELVRFAMEDAENIALRTRLVKENPSILDYHRQVLTVRWSGALTDLVAGRLEVDVADDPRPAMWTAVALTSFRVGFEQWLGTGRLGDLAAFVERAVLAASAAFEPRRSPAQAPSPGGR